MPPAELLRAALPGAAAIDRPRHLTSRAALPRSARPGSRGGTATASPKLSTPCSRRCSAYVRYSCSHGARRADVAEPALFLEAAESLSERWCGNRPSSRPQRNTTGNSRPLAECSVIICTQSSHASAWPSPDSSTACARNARRAAASRCRLVGLEAARRRSPARSGSRRAPRRDPPSLSW